MNPNQIAVSDTVSFARWVGHDVADDVYIIVTGEVLRIDQEQGTSPILTHVTSWLSTKKNKKKASQCKITGRNRRQWKFRFSTCSGFHCF